MDEVTIKKLVGKRIKQFRNNLKLSQFSLGEKIDINQRQIAQIECGKSFPSLRTLNNLAQIFDCEIKDFFSYGHLIPEKDLKHELSILIKKLNSAQIRLLYLIAHDIYKEVKEDM